MSVLLILWPYTFPVMWSLPVGEAASPGMFSPPDTRTFSGRRCIIETSAGCFFITQSKCAPSIVFRRLLSAKKDITNLCRIISLFHMHFMTKGQTGTLNTNELNMIFHPTIIPNPPKETSSIYLAPQSVIFPQKQWVTWQHDTQHTDTSIFQYSIWVLVT